MAPGDLILGHCLWKGSCVYPTAMYFITKTMTSFALTISFYGVINGSHQSTPKRQADVTNCNTIKFISALFSISWHFSVRLQLGWTGSARNSIQLISLDLIFEVA